MTNITFDPITKKFTQVVPEEKTCYICSSSIFIDDHHIDCQGGKVSPETVPFCRRCHTTYHIWGVVWFDDEYLDRIIEIENRRRVLFGLPLMVKEKIKRSKYWKIKHRVNEVITLDPVSNKFTQERLL